MIYADAHVKYSQSWVSLSLQTEGIQSVTESDSEWRAIRLVPQSSPQWTSDREAEVLSGALKIT